MYSIKQCNNAQPTQNSSVTPQERQKKAEQDHRSEQTETKQRFHLPNTQYRDIEPDVFCENRKKRNEMQSHRL
jgi:hypothetical protein